ncbi:protein NETWORKED 1D-like [Zingiber officinale]|uniref:NAB domain-containing protein n=1 Tax=Zingiber officinale TaxID=94328 RepID=A0A8J5GXQ1_ZINOF|nr:protein NETWORKED 1D-like [Zingiber officinale]XP_042384395.1 protein NETWORKED 1D-like [Zingiber officinale]KAG6512061.1 hypothetical protein ZIOFF_030154 [Zingiber officinale]
MATLSCAESRRLYSWWWDSHISPKLSKWLRDNLTDMDNKIKSMIGLIEEDADSFAQRAEMYYKKRPELINLVEEFYRAYRALAERYDHATGALCRAHQTIVKAFPNQIPDEISVESLYESPAPGSRMNNHQMPMGISDPEDAVLLRDLLGLSLYGETVTLDEAYSDESKVESFENILKQINEMFPSKEDEAGAAFGNETEDNFLDYKLLWRENSRLLKENQELKQQIASESACADKSENDIRCLKEVCFNEKSEKQDVLFQYEVSIARLSYLEHEISHIKAELKQLNDEMTIEASSLNSAEEQSLVSETNHSLQLEFDILKQKIRKQKENLDRKAQELEILNMSLQNEQQRNLTVEMTCRSIKQQHTKEIKHLELEIKSGVEKLKDAEEKLEKLREENGRLRQHKLSSALKIATLQDEIISLMDLRRKFEDEIDHIEQNEDLQLELHCLTNNKYDSEGKYHMLLEEIQAVNLKVQSLQVSIKDSRLNNVELADTLKMNRTAQDHNLENLNHMQWQSENNAALEASHSNANDELHSLRMKIEELEESQVVGIEKSLESLEGRCHEGEDKNLTLEKGRDLMLHCVAKLQELLQLEKEKQNTLSQSRKSQLKALSDQIHLLKEECCKREDVFDMEQLKIMNAEIELFVLQRCLCEMKDENLFLSVKSHKDEEALRHTEGRILELERECLNQEQEMQYLVENNEKLREWVRLLMQSLKIDLQYVPIEDIKNGIILQVALREIQQMLNAISDAKDEKQRLLLENSVVLALLEHFQKYAAELRAEKAALVEESRVRLLEYTMLRSKKDELHVTNEELKKEIQVSNQRVVTLKAEVDLLFRQLMYSQEVHRALQIEVSKLVEESKSISKKLLDLSQAKVKLEEEDNVMLAEVLATDYLSTIFKSLNSDREYEITLLSNERALLYELAIKLEQKIILLEEENTNLKVPLSNMNCCRSSQTLVVSSRLLQVNHRHLELDDCGFLLQENLFEMINATVCKAKVLELIETYENLQSNAILQREVQEEITLSQPVDELEKKIGELEEENNELRADLSAHELFLGLLWDDIVVLEELTLSLTKRHSTSTSQIEEVNQLEFYPSTASNQDASSDCNASTPMRLYELQEKVKVLQEVLINTGSMIELERFDSHASLEAAWKEIEWLKSKGKRNSDKSASKSRRKRNTNKDVQLDIVFNPPRRGNKILSHGRKDRENSETDQKFEVWGTGYGSKNDTSGSWLTENNRAYYQSEEGENYTSSRLVAEKQYLPCEVAPLQEWNKRVIKWLCSDAQRLSVLQASLQELHKSAEKSIKIRHLPRPEINSIKDQLKVTDESLSQLIDVNNELKSNVENLSPSSSYQIDESDIESKRRKQIFDWARKASEKIGRLEFEIPKIKYSLLKFDEEHMNQRARIKRRPGIQLREFIYGRRNTRRHKEASP